MTERKVGEDFIDKNLYLEKNPVLCCDDRSFEGIEETWYHVPGGLSANMAWNKLVLDEVESPGSSEGLRFDECVGDMTELMVDKDKFNIYVHSDKKNEGDTNITIDTEKIEGPVGCAYINQRDMIAKNNVTKRKFIVQRVIELFPNIFIGGEEISFANNAIDAIERLSNNPTLFYEGFGRKAVLAAVAAGAKSALAEGEHVSDTAEFFIDPDSTLRTKDAVEAGKSKYVHDLSVVEEAFITIRRNFTYTPKKVTIVSIIDALATFSTLGIKLSNVRVNDLYQ